MEDDIITLQTKLGHQEHEIRGLSDELYAQQKEITRLKHQMNELKEMLRSMSDDRSTTPDTHDEPPPPHY